MKKLSVIICLALLTSCIFSSCNFSTAEPSTIEPTTENSTSQSSPGAYNQGITGPDGASAYSSNSIDNVASDELRISKNKDITVKFVKGVFSKDATSEEYNTEDVMNIKKQEIELYYQKLGKEVPEITESKYSKYCLEFSDVDFSGKVLYGSLLIKPNEMTLTKDSTDEEIIEYFKNHKELTALAEYANLNIDNVYVKRILEGRRADDNNEFTWWCDFAIYEKAWLPEDNAYNSTFNAITFSIYANQDSDPDFEGTYFKASQQVSDDFNGKNLEVTEVTIPSSEYKKAADIAAQRIKSEYELTENITANKLKVCTISYDFQSKEGYGIPAYRFYYAQENIVYYTSVSLTDYLPA